MSAAFNFEKLVKQVYEATDKALSLNELEELLSLGEDAYQKDSPISVGKSLTILSLEFNGTKILEGDNQPIYYSRTFVKGINMWVGGNLVGKSSVFKIIKLALTGRKNKNFKTVAGWLDQIWLEFSIGRNFYTVHIQKDKNQHHHFRLLNGGRNAVVATVDGQKETAIFEGGVGQYEPFIQGFFFREMSYYPLQWTQHSSKKDSADLSTANAGWATYFKSVFLEAEEYDELFYGQQAELIFQMLLGLELTYPINRLKIKREQLLNKLGKIRAIADAPDEDEEGISTKAREELQKVLLKLEQLSAATEAASNSIHQEDEQKLENIRQLYASTLRKRSNLEAEFEQQSRKQSQLQRRLNSLTSRINDYKIDITKAERAVNDLQEFLEFGAFFSGLEVKTCPNCTHSVEKQRIVHERNSGNCRLCDHELDHEQAVDKELYEKRRKTLEDQRQVLFADQYNLKVELEQVKTQLCECLKRIQEIDKEIQNLPVESLKGQISELQEQMVQKTISLDWQAHFAEVQEYSTKKALLEHQLTNKKSSQAGLDEQVKPLQHKIKVLQVAEEELKRQRTERSEDILRTFEALYLKQLHAFGLPHYDRVEIKPNFKVAYFFQGQESGFDEITAGEKLRAKLGLYIALIEMDIKYQAGRHPQFIILDSPAKEEGDNTYIEGLKATLTYIQLHFGNDLQVFVGTAERALATAVDSQQVEEKAEGVYFF